MVWKGTLFAVCLRYLFVRHTCMHEGAQHVALCRR